VASLRFSPTHRGTGRAPRRSRTPRWSGSLPENSSTSTCTPLAPATRPFWLALSSKPEGKERLISFVADTCAVSVSLAYYYDCRFNEVAITRLPAMMVERLRSPSRPTTPHRLRKRPRSIEVTSTFLTERNRHLEPSLPTQCSRVDREGVKGRAVGNAMVR
jgi:hypothetical protein